MVENEIYIAVTVWNPRTKPINKKPTLILASQKPYKFQVSFHGGLKDLLEIEIGKDKTFNI